MWFKNIYNMSAQDYDNAIYTTVINSGYSDTLANLIVAQAHEESTQGGIPYNNNAFLNGNNAFGYKYVKGAKYQLADEGNVSSEGNAYAKYPSIQNSVLEVLSWLERRQSEGKFVIANIQTPEDYANALKAGDYYGETSAEYASGLSLYVKMFKGTVINFAKENPYTSIAMAIGISVGLYAYITFVVLKRKK